jgi:serine/threonine protein kinase
LREFSGIEKYLTVSADNSWLVRVLYVGRNDERGYFFYTMEAGDDENSGSQIDPAKYEPKNLSKELSKRGQFSVAECLSLGLHLTDALKLLHKNGLIHRDIKPSNVIYIGGIPKLADIGLVTEFARMPKASSYVGTMGYIPPEGPGTVASDLYSLGKVLYEASTGRDRQQYPDLPTNVMDGSAESGLLEFNEVVLKACESNPEHRYKSAEEMHADLLSLQERLRANLGSRKL